MNEPVIFYSNTKIDKNIKYLINCDVGDDFCLIKTDGHTTALISALEINRLRKESTIDEIIPLEQLRITENMDYISCLDRFIQQTIHTREIMVAQNFPYNIASKLLSMGYSIKPSPYSFLPEREQKNDNEITIIKNILSSMDECFAYIRSILEQSKITNDRRLNYNDSLLTSEFLRDEIEQFCYQHRLIADGTIVSCGKQSADPHCQGYGPLLANEFIIIDLFPHEKTTGYYADITRTFLKGHASDKQTRMYNAVQSAQKLCEEKLSAGVNGSDLMESVLDFFTKNGYPTDRSAQVPYGMFHSLGHGFGLDIHEFPTLSSKEYFLKERNVVTLEPGIYYPEIGGVRIEDDFLVTKIGAVKLSKNIRYDWVID